MFAFNKLNIPINPYLSKPLEDEDLIVNANLDNWDREGYESLPIEQEFYKANNIHLSFKEVFAKESGIDGGWFAAIQKWVTQTTHNDIFHLDHSFFVVRYGFRGEAEKQIRRLSKYNSKLLKLIATKPKYGLDFCLDAIVEDEIMEVLHFEWDYKSYDSIKNALPYFEKRIANTDWLLLLSKIIETKHLWKDMTATQQGDFKANLFGIEESFRLYKSM